MELTILVAVIFFVIISRMWKKIAKFDAEMEEMYQKEINKRNK